MADAPLDIIYLFKHSRHRDDELCFSLRSVAAHLPFIRKVWVFGDRPTFLSTNRSLIEHVPHQYIAPLLGYKTPVKSDMLMLVLASLLPELSFDFVRFSDDYIILQPLSRQQLCTVRALEDLNQLPERGNQKWKQILWRTFDILKRYGYAGYNFEAHVPTPMNRKMIFEAYMAFRQFQSEDRHGGVLTATTVYNYALKHFGLDFVWIADEQSRAGFYGSCPDEEAIEAACLGKLFANFDDSAFGPAMLRYLTRLFPKSCKFERQSSPLRP